MTAQREAEQRLRQAEAEKGELRARLLKQFSLVLETRDTERGLVVNMPDILFESGKFTLAARSPGEAGAHRRHHRQLSEAADRGRGTYGQCRVGRIQSETLGTAGIRGPLLPDHTRACRSDRLSGAVKGSKLRLRETTRPRDGGRTGGWS